MGIPSTINLLAPDILDKLQELLRDPRITQCEATRRINDILLEKGEDPVSKSAVNRYSLKFKDVMAKKQESSEVVKQWLAQVGAIPDGDFGRAITEILRTLAFDFSLMAHNEGITAEGLPNAVKMLKDLAFAVDKMESAATINEKRSVQIRQQAKEETMKQVATTAKAEGVSEATIGRIRDALGMEPA